eukprot:10166928-Alexandrium_andersonii.AAC.1
MSSVRHLWCTPSVVHDATQRRHVCSSQPSRTRAKNAGKYAVCSFTCSFPQGLGRPCCGLILSCGAYTGGKRTRRRNVHIKRQRNMPI